MTHPRITSISISRLVISVSLILLAVMPAAAQSRSGNKKAFQALVGQMMKRTKGKGNPALIQKLLKGEIGE